MNENWDIIGHEWAVTLLRRSLTAGRLRHAYLFSGPQQIGRRTLALRLAQAALCAQPLAPGQPCGQCRDCRQLAAQQHPDLHLVQAEKQGGTLKVEQVRAVRRNLNLRPYQANRRVVLFLRFEEAHPSAANALLKTLEEAPPHALLLLTASAPEALLPTIVSRCEVLRLHPVPREAIYQALLQRGADEAQATLLSNLAAGRPGRAFSLLQNPQALDFRRQAIGLLLQLLPATHPERFRAAARLARERETLRQHLLLWVSFWHDVMRQLAAPQLPLTNSDYATDIAAVAAGLTFQQAAALVRRHEAALQALAQNANPLLLTEALMLDWPRLATS